MMTWITLAVAAQFLSALSILVDRHIVVRAQHIGKPIVYAFYVSLLSGLVVIAAPFFEIAWPSWRVLTLSLANAATFVAAIFYLYSGLRVARASDIAPVVGAVSALTTFAAAALWISGDVSGPFVVPLGLLIVGTAIISHFHFTRRALAYALVSGLMFGASVFLAKLVYLETDFADGFFWTRAMNVMIALALLLVPAFRIAIFRGGKQSSHGARLLVIGNKVLAGSASVLTALAISLGSVSIVNSLAGFQFVFLFIFSILFGRRMPIFDDDSAHGHGGWRTGIGVSLIVFGLALLSLGHFLPV